MKQTTWLILKLYSNYYWILKGWVFLKKKERWALSELDPKFSILFISSELILLGCDR